MSKIASGIISDLSRSGVTIQISKYDFFTEKLTTLGDSGVYPIASVYKFILLLEKLSALSESVWTREVEVLPENHAVGFGVIRGLPDPVKLTLGNLAYLAIFNSDGTAAEHLFNNPNIPTFVKLPFRFGKKSILTMHHNEMVSVVSKFWSAIGEDRNLKEKRAARHSFFSDPANSGGSTSAEEIVTFLKQKVQPLFSSSGFLKKMLKNELTGPVRANKRMFSNLPGSIHWVGKTGTLGFGYVLNDSGILIKDGVLSQAIAVTSFGWEEPMEVAERKIAEMTAAFLLVD